MFLKSRFVWLVGRAKATGIELHISTLFKVRITNLPDTYMPINQPQLPTTVVCNRLVITTALLSVSYFPVVHVNVTDQLFELVKNDLVNIVADIS